MRNRSGGMRLKRSWLLAAAALLALTVAAIVLLEVRPDAAQTGDFVIESAILDGDQLRVTGYVQAGDAVVTGARYSREGGCVIAQILTRASVLAGRWGDEDADRIDIAIPTEGRAVDRLIFQGWTRLDRMEVQIGQTDGEG